MSAVVPVEKANPTEEAAMQSLATGILLLPVLVAGIFLERVRHFALATSYIE